MKRLKEQWPDAKTFSALVRYPPEVSAEYEKRQRLAEKHKQANLDEQRQQDRLEEQRKSASEIVERFRSTWLALTDGERSIIELTVRAQWPHIAQVPAMFDRYCIQEFARWQSAEETTDAARR